MFQGFAGQWTPVWPASEVAEGQAVGVKVAGEKVALFRARGRLGALLDRCPHRGVELSRGRVSGAGTLVCPFHGWAFDAAGECVEVPLSATRPEQRARMCVPALPVREAGGLVWVRTSLGPSVDAPDLPESLGEEWSRWVHHEVWRTHWTRAMENMLDFPHLPFVHASTIGRGLRGRLGPSAVMSARLEPTAFGGRVRAELDGASIGSLEWRRPNGMVLLLDDGAREARMRMHIYCVPIDATSTRMILVASRNFGRYNPLWRVFDELNRRILFEDRRIIESADPPEVPPASQERSVANDGPTLAFRRYYFDTLRSSGGPLVQLARRAAPAPVDEAALP